MLSSNRGCLIIGAPRSGTTLCATMIGVHPDIGMHLEDPRHSTQPILGVKVWGNKLCIPNQITFRTPADERTIWKKLEDGARAILGRPRWSKDYPCPANQRTIQSYVAEGARLVAMIRDPDHVVDSIRRRGDVTVEKGKERWSKAIRAIWHTSREYEELTYLIQFEDLVKYPEAAMRGVCALLELPYSPKMPEGYAHTPQYNHDRLDPSVATRDVKSYNLREFDSGAFEKYNELVRSAALEETSVNR